MVAYWLESVLPDPSVRGSSPTRAGCFSGGQQHYLQKYLVNIKYYYENLIDLKFITFDTLLFQLHITRSY